MNKLRYSSLVPKTNTHAFLCLEEWLRNKTRDDQNKIVNNQKLLVDWTPYELFVSRMKSWCLCITNCIYSRIKKWNVANENIVDYWCIEFMKWIMDYERLEIYDCECWLFYEDVIVIVLLCLVFTSVVSKVDVIVINMNQLKSGV